MPPLRPIMIVWSGELGERDAPLQSALPTVSPWHVTWPESRVDELGGVACPSVRQARGLGISRRPLPFEAPDSMDGCG
jgi:hypothetical protein